jgi:hypothetical protein
VPGSLPAPQTCSGGLWGLVLKCSPSGASPVRDAHEGARKDRQGVGGGQGRGQHRSDCEARSPGVRGHCGEEDSLGTATTSYSLSPQTSSTSPAAGIDACHTRVALSNGDRQGRPPTAGIGTRGDGEGGIR